jgi:hypothetical protein
MGFRCDVRSALVREEWKDRFSLTPEDYLHGVITVINELVRNLWFFSLHCV